MVFSFDFRLRMFSGAEKDCTALYTMCVCALLLHLQSYELNERFTVVVALTVSDCTVSRYFVVLLRMGFSISSSKICGGGRVAYLQTWNTEKL